jgi:hypothetical protein
MSKSVVRLELERAYRVLVDSQKVHEQDDERQLWAAMNVIVAWEAVADEVRGMCEQSSGWQLLTTKA